MNQRAAIRTAQWVTAIILLIGVAAILVPSVGTWLDGLSGAPTHVLAERRVATVSVDQVSGYLPHQVRTETTESIPVLASGPLAFALAMPGLFFFFRVGLTALVAFIGAALVHAVLSGRFSFQLPGFALGEDPDAAARALTTLAGLVVPPPSAQAAAPPPPSATPAPLGPVPMPGSAPEPQYIPVRASLQNARATVAEFRSTRARKYEYVRDPALSIAALRLDLDESLRILAQRHGIAKGDIDAIVGALVDRGVIARPQADAILELIILGDRAVRGERFADSTARAIREAAPEIFRKLDELIDRAGPPPAGGVASGT